MDASQKHESLSVIGAGLSRTGTSSLKLALEQLLGGKCYHSKELALNPGHIPYWIKASEQGDLSPEEWKTIFKEYRATVDYPGCPFYANILRVFPDAKVILSVRDPHSWLKSMRATIVPARQIIFSFPTNVFLFFTPLCRLGDWLRKDRCLDDIEDDERALLKFNNWAEKVKATVPSENLLIFEAKMGWEPLCKFLHLPVPDEPFPNVNSTSEMLITFNIVKGLSYAFVFGVPVLISVLCWWGYNKLTL